MPLPLLVRRSACTVTLIAVATLSGCAMTQSPPGHSARLTKAAGLARITLVCSKDLWTETKPGVIGDNDVHAQVTPISSGPRAGRGLVRVSMTGTNLVAYLKELDRNAHPTKWREGDDNRAASRRVYDALTPALDRIKPATRASDPEPEIIIDDTIPDEH